LSDIALWLNSRNSHGEIAVAWLILLLIKCVPKVEMGPYLTRAYFWPAVNKRPICLRPGYFLTQPEGKKIKKFDIYRGNFPNSNPNHKWLPRPDTTQATKNWPDPTCGSKLFDPSLTWSKLPTWFLLVEVGPTYFWPAVNKRLTRLWPRYFFTPSQEIFFDSKGKNWKFGIFRANFPNPKQRWLTQPNPSQKSLGPITSFWYEQYQTCLSSNHDFKI